MEARETDVDEVAKAVDLVREALRGLSFGAVEVQVHDAQVVRVTRTEKVRVELPREVARKGGARS